MARAARASLAAIFVLLSACSGSDETDGKADSGTGNAGKGGGKDGTETDGNDVQDGGAGSGGTSGTDIDGGVGESGGGNSEQGTIVCDGPIDCAGVCNGIAVVDDCGVCNGKNADKDCEGVCFGPAVPDCEGVCNGSAETDCAGVCNGSARVDDCGFCVRQATDTSCRGPFKLLADDGTENDEFGYAVAVSGDTIVVGAPYDDDHGGGSGSAYVFVREGDTWAEQAKLNASDADESDHFGDAVAVSGDIIVVGTQYDEEEVAGNVMLGTGAAYVFVREGDTWTEQAKLTANDAAAEDSFGVSVAVSGNTALVGASNHGYDDSGATYVFVQEGTDWIQREKLIASDAAAEVYFGFSVGISGDTAVIGAHRDNDDAPDSGAAYVFVREGGNWTEQAKLKPDNVEADDGFGGAVAISGNTAVIGASGHEEVNGSSGAAYVFVRRSGAWRQQAMLTAADQSSYAYFGDHVTVSGDTALIGSPSDGSFDLNTGLARVFVREGTNWIQQAKIFPDDAEDEDLFGCSVSADGDIAVIGMYNDDDLGTDSGSAFVYELPGW